jgi:hypothetical protein
VRLPVIALLLLAATAIAARGAEPESSWIADAAGCKIVNPNPKPDESVKWSGACKDGFAEGKGVLEYTTGGKPGARYEGRLQRGRFDGRGILRTPDGAVYDGDWVEGTQDGYGEYTAPDKTVYKGGWTAGKPDGPGVLTTPDGQTVKGIWSRGEYLTAYPEIKSGITRPDDSGAKTTPGAAKAAPEPGKKKED